MVYLAVINLFYVFYMLFFRREPFNADAYFGFLKAFMRYAAFTLASGAVVPLVFSAFTRPRKVIYMIKQMAWIRIVIPFVLVLSAGAYYMYKNASAAYLPLMAPSPVYKAEPAKAPEVTAVGTDSGGYINVDEALPALGYVRQDGAYLKDFPKTRISFDLSANRARKNDFYFKIEGSYTSDGNNLYISPQALSNILGMNVECRGNKAYISAIREPAHYWTSLCGGLVAHATGGIDNKDYPDCYESLVTNYNLGHRVFEMDFNLTSDDKLVVVHDWSGYGGQMSWQDFMSVKIWGVFTSMDIDTVTDILAVNPDMYVVTDTKSFDYSDANTIKQFDLIIQSAKRYGDGVLNRIVPQIYDQHMYNLIESQYYFPSIIYTLYESPDTDDQAAAFVAGHGDIKAVTMAPARFSDDFCKKLSGEGKLIYLFTLNDLSEVLSYRERGVWGFYTDFIVPADMGGG